MHKTIAGCLALLLTTGALTPLAALELPRRFAIAEAALAAQFAERSARQVRSAPLESMAKTEKKRSRGRLYLSAALTAGVGFVAYWSKEQSDRAYDRYLHSANIARQNKEFDKAKRFDRIAGASFIGMEVGVVLSSYLLFFGR